MEAQEEARRVPGKGGVRRRQTSAVAAAAAVGRRCRPTCCLPLLLLATHTGDGCPSTDCAIVMHRRARQHRGTQQYGGVRQYR